MLELAKKYQEEVFWAFKPHPLLRPKLEYMWGEKRTADYYSEWERLENAQVETGKYIGLFMHSDAMIHDCGSFTVEYHYSGKPVMYLMSDNDLTLGFNEFQQRAFDLHYKGWSESDIEKFIIDVINGIDPMAKDRTEFLQKSLTPPNGKDASENIIEVLLSSDAERRVKFS